MNHFGKLFSEYNVHGEGMELRITNILDNLNESLKTHIFVSDDSEKKVTRVCPNGCGGELSLKVSRFGAFVGCANYPDCKFTRPISHKKVKEVFDDIILGIDEVTSKEIKLLSGRFGPYIQLGEMEGKEKPKRASIPKNISPNDIDLEKAKLIIKLAKKSR